MFPPSSPQSIQHIFFLFLIFSDFFREQEGKSERARETSREFSTAARHLLIFFSTNIDTSANNEIQRRRLFQNNFAW